MLENRSVMLTCELNPFGWSIYWSVSGSLIAINEKAITAKIKTLYSW